MDILQDMPSLMDRIKENDKELDKLFEQFVEDCNYIKEIIRKLPDKKKEEEVNV